MVQSWFEKGEYLGRWAVVWRADVKRKADTSNAAEQIVLCYRSTWNWLWQVVAALRVPP